MDAEPKRRPPTEIWEAFGRGEAVTPDELAWMYRRRLYLTRNASPETYRSNLLLARELRQGAALLTGGAGTSNVTHEPPPFSDVVTINGCSACGGRHVGLQSVPVPVEARWSPKWTHVTSCPATGKAVYIGPDADPVKADAPAPTTCPPAEASAPAPVKVGEWDLDENGVWWRHYIHERWRGAAAVDKDGSWKVFRPNGMLFDSGLSDLTLLPSRQVKAGKGAADSALSKRLGVVLDAPAPAQQPAPVDLAVGQMDAALRFVLARVYFSHIAFTSAEDIKAAVEKWNATHTPPVRPADVGYAMRAMGANTNAVGYNFVRLRADQ